MEPLLEGFLRSLGGSEANFLELCFGRFPCGNFHTKATSKKFRPPSGNFRPNPPELPRSPSRSFSSRETGWRTLLIKVAHLQSEFCTKDFFRATDFLTKNAPKISPKFLRLCSVGQKKSWKIPSKFPTQFSKFPCEESKKIHRRASAGAHT